ncbi:hypothetical protein MMC12_001195 [Toensbergia leucococca]|nr:hypothetical protein [Toensbergia leucococca]
MPQITAHHSSSAAPLPSPSTNQPLQYFPPKSQHRHRTSLSHPQPPQSQQQGRISTESEMARGGADDSTTVTPFLRDLNLVAEAAKRAQMAVLMRDMGEVAL